MLNNSFSYRNYIKDNKFKWLLSKDRKNLKKS